MGKHWSERLSCRCGITFRNYSQEARHRHNFPLLCRKPIEDGDFRRGDKVKVKSRLFPVWLEGNVRKVLNKDGGKQVVVDARAPDGGAKMVCVTLHENISLVDRPKPRNEPPPSPPWHDWTGGKQPVHAMAVEVERRDKVRFTSMSGRLDWAHNKTGTDIVRWRLVG